MNAIAPQWLDRFEGADHEAKRDLLRQVVSDWLSGLRTHNVPVHLASGLLLPHAALLELLHSASAARRNVIEEEVTETLVGALHHRPAHYEAAAAIDGFLVTHPDAAAGIAARLSAAIAARTQSASRCLLDGIELLAADSQAARKCVIPVLLENFKAALLCSRPGFSQIGQAFDDIAWVKGLGQSSPYDQALAVAWPSGTVSGL